MNAYRNKIRLHSLLAQGLYVEELTREELLDFDKGVVARVLGRTLEGSHLAVFYALYFCIEEEWEQSLERLNRDGVKLNMKSFRQYANEAYDDMAKAIAESKEWKEWLNKFKTTNPAKAKFITPSTS